MEKAILEDNFEEYGWFFMFFPFCQSWSNGEKGREGNTKNKGGGGKTTFVVYAVSCNHEK